MKICGLFLCLAFFACTLTIGTPKTSHHPAAAGRKTKTKTKTEIVDAKWIERYRELEAKFNYRIPQDIEIMPADPAAAGFRVPSEVIGHFEDMTKAQ